MSLPRDCYFCFVETYFNKLFLLNYCFLRLSYFQNFPKILRTSALAVPAF